MTIEFHCPHCEKLLRTADDKAGVQANCPGCGQLVAVPTQSLEESALPVSGGLPPAIGPEQTCPMCGALNAVTEIRCRVCGEGLADRASGVIHPRILDTGNVLNVTWGLYKAKLGLCIGSVAIFFGILWAVQLVTQMLLTGVQVAAGAGRGGGGRGDDEVLAVILAVGMWIVQQLVSVYLTLGQVNLMLKIARGESAQISDMFSVGRFYVRSLGASILFGLMVFVGTLLLIFPGIIVAVMFFPFNFYLIDQDAGVIDSLQGARRVTEGNRLTIFVLFLIAFGLNFAGLLACCVGALFSYGYVMLMQAVAYQMATGRAVARG